MYNRMKKFLELLNGGYGMVGAKKLLLPSDHPAIADHLKHLGEPNCSADEVVEDIIASPSSGPSGPGNSDSGAADPGEPGGNHSHNKTRVKPKRKARLRPMARVRLGLRRMQRSVQMRSPNTSRRP